MELSNNVIGYIGNPNFCTAKEAFEYAKNSNNIGSWRKVLSRPDLPLSLAIKGAGISKETEAWIIVLSRPDMDASLALQCAIKLKNDAVWAAVLERSDLIDVEAAYTRATTLDNLDVWISVLSRVDGDPKEVLKKACEIDDSSVWSAVLSLDHINAYLDTISKDLMLELVTKSAHYNLCMRLVDRNDLEASDALSFAKIAGYSELWSIVLKMENVKAYLATLDSDKLIALAIEVDKKKFWEKILTMPIIKPDASFFHLKETDDDFVWKKVLKREDVILWLDRLAPAVLVAIGKKINYWRIWQLIVARENVINYLNNLSSEDAINLAVECDNMNLSDLIIQRPSFPFLDAFEIAKKSKDSSSWSAATKKSDFLEYISSLSDDDAIAFAQVHNHFRIWKIVLARPSIIPSKAISYAKIAKDGNVWDVVIRRPDVVSFLESKK